MTVSNARVMYLGMWVTTYS